MASRRKQTIRPSIAGTRRLMRQVSALRRELSTVRTELKNQGELAEVWKGTAGIRLQAIETLRTDLQKARAPVSARRQSRHELPVKIVKRKRPKR